MHTQTCTKLKRMRTSKSILARSGSPHNVQHSLVYNMEINRGHGTFNGIRPFGGGGGEPTLCVGVPRTGCGLGTREELCSLSLPTKRSQGTSLVFTRHTFDSIIGFSSKSLRSDALAKKR